MKKANLTDNEKKELELLKYRNFVSTDSAHFAPKRSGAEQSDFVEFGYFAGTARINSDA